MKKRLLKIVPTVAAVILVLALLQELLMPKYMTDIIEGAMIEEYYDSEKNHDVIFLGDCEVYETFSPCRLWEQYGISSYVRGSAQQLIWQSYYLLEDTLKYETPEVASFKDDISNNVIEAFNKQFKYWYKTRYGFNSFESANSMIMMFVFFYNFIRPHSSLSNLTPAQVAGLKYSERQQNSLLLVS